MDWSWRVRHMTIQQLTKICQMTKKDTLKDGLQNVAWTLLLSHHSIEADRRVLEAYKIARVRMMYQIVCFYHYSFNTSYSF